MDKLSDMSYFQRIRMFAKFQLDISLHNFSLNYQQIELNYIEMCMFCQFIMHKVLMDRTIHNYHLKDLQTLDQRMLKHKGLFGYQQIMFMYLTNIYIYKF